MAPEETGTRDREAIVRSTAYQRHAPQLDFFGSK